MSRVFVLEVHTDDFTRLKQGTLISYKVDLGSPSTRRVGHSTSVTRTTRPIKDSVVSWRNTSETFVFPDLTPRTCGLSLYEKFSSYSQV